MADFRAAARREGSGPSAGWPSWARRLVTAGLLFHLAAVVAGALGVPPSSELERRIADLFTPYHDLVDQGYAYRYYAEPPPTPVITATLRFGDGRPDETVRLPGRSLGGPRMRHQRQLALANALFADVQEAKRHGGEGARSRLAERLCPPPLPGLSRLQGGHPPCPAAPDPRSRARPRGPRVARRAPARPLRRGRSSPPRNGSETSRATAPERDLGLPGRAGVRHPTRLGRLLLHARRSHGAGPDPRGGRRCWPSGACSSSVSTSTTYFGLARLGRPDRDLADTMRQRQPLAWSFWFLVPDVLLRPVWLALPGDPGAVHGGAVQPGDRRAGLGDRGLDRQAGADRAFRLRPDPLDPGALPGRHVRERPGGLARPLPAAVARRPREGPRRPVRTVPRPARRVSPGEPGVPSPRSRPTWRSG